MPVDGGTPTNITNNDVQDLDPDWGVATSADVTAPLITLTTPVNGATYKLKRTITAAYECSDEPGGSGVKSCEGTVANGSPIDTSTSGTKTFTVTAKDNVGNERSVTHSYDVTASGNPPPSGGGKGGGPKPK